MVSIPTKQQDVHIFVFDSMSTWEAGYAIDGINNPQFQKNPGCYRVRSVGLSNDSVKTVGGISIQPELTLTEFDPANSAMLILPGGVAWDEGKNSEAIDLAGEFISVDKPVAAICGATAGLARGGLLDTRKHTSNAREYLEITQYAGSDFYQDRPTVTDQNIITAPAMMPVDFAYHIFKYLDIYSMPVLEAWYGLFKTGDNKYFGELMKAVNS